MPATAYSHRDVQIRRSSFAENERAAGSTARARGRHAQSGGRGRKPLAATAALAFTASLAAALLAGWHYRDEGHLTPDSGTGYWLGIAGASAMLLLLLYPLRKRMKSLRALGSVSGWFRLHMALGLVGPTLILFHCNFRFGSLNSNVALFSMLAVAGSGLVGRYLYGRVHLGLYGRRARIEDVLNEVLHRKNAFEGEVWLPPAVLQDLDAHAARVLADRRGAVSSLFALLVQRLRAPAQRARLLDEAARHIAAQSRQHRWSWWARRKRMRELRGLLRQYFRAVNKAAAFAFYERLFALWHVLHMPLFILLILAATVHVIGAHLY